jgi:hypothetical protein
VADTTATLVDTTQALVTSTQTLKDLMEALDGVRGAPDVRMIPNVSDADVTTATSAKDITQRGADKAREAADLIGESSRTLDGDARAGVEDARTSVEDTVLDLLDELYKSMVDVHKTKHEVAVDGKKKFDDTGARGIFVAVASGATLPHRVSHLAPPACTARLGPPLC